MPGIAQDPWLDDAAGRLVRPYTVCDGRTRPKAELDLVTQVCATGRGGTRWPGPEHARVVELCGPSPVSVAEISALAGLPVGVTKVLLSDLLECGAVAAGPSPAAGDPTDRELLEAVLHGLRTRL
ncbi:DUF742 domain-containing protein [Streptomyces sodiiphilus]|uniref:DUF742 domain-containing protein n=1 Tax=Streptomyces sodiiphilus TaxID=226217 RepID=A0ABP5B6I7_9ACTN